MWILLQACRRRAHFCTWENVYCRYYKVSSADRWTDAQTNMLRGSIYFGNFNIKDSVRPKRSHHDKVDGIFQSNKVDNDVRCMSCSRCRITYWPKSRFELSASGGIQRKPRYSSTTWYKKKKFRWNFLRLSLRIAVDTFLKTNKTMRERLWLKLHERWPRLN